MERAKLLAYSAALLFVGSWFVAVRSAAPDEPKTAPGFNSLFNGTDLAGWREHGGMANEWSVQDGLIHCKGSGGGGLFTDKQYTNFEIELEFRLAAGGNSGVWIRAPLSGNPSYTGLEIQLLDDTAAQYANLQPEQYCGSLWDVAAAQRGAAKAAGDRQKIGILCKDQRLKVTLNGAAVLDSQLDQHKDKESAHPGLTRTTGYFGLQNDTGQLDFRNVRIRELPQGDRVKTNSAVSDQTADEKQEFDELVKLAQAGGQDAVVSQIQAWWPTASHADRADYYKTNRPK